MFVVVILVVLKSAFGGVGGSTDTIPKQLPSRPNSLNVASANVSVSARSRSSSSLDTLPAL